MLTTKYGVVSHTFSGNVSLLVAWTLKKIHIVGIYLTKTMKAKYNIVINGKTDDMNTNGYIGILNCTIQRAKQYFDNTERLDELMMVLERSRVTNSNVGTAISLDTSNAHQKPSSCSNTDKQGEQKASLTLMESVFSNLSDLVENPDLVGLHGDCLASRGKRYFDAFKRRVSCELKIGSTTLQTNSAQIRWAMLASKYGVLKYVQNNLSKLQEQHLLNRKKRRRIQQQLGKKNNGSKGRKKRVYQHCIGTQNVYM